MKKLSAIIAILFIILMSACTDKDMITIKNKNGLAATFTPEGARIVRLSVPDRNQRPVDIVIGFDSVAQYATSTEPYFGATIGRYGNRIANGKMEIEGTSYQLDVNNGPNTLHGGIRGFQAKRWEAEKIGDSSIVFTRLSADGEEGFPGNLTTTVTYTLTHDNSLKIEYNAVTDKTTVVNLTNHAFFNLNGEDGGSIDNHVLQINAEHYTPVDSTLIPTGDIALVYNTPFDFSNPMPIGRRINFIDTQLIYGKGYDHNYVLKGSGMKKAATISGDKTGIVMDIYTEEPGLQFYSGNFMQGKNNLRKGPDNFRTAFCLETQHFPNSPNEKAFPTTILKPGEKYHTVSIYKFSTL